MGDEDINVISSASQLAVMGCSSKEGDCRGRGVRVGVGGGGGGGCGGGGGGEDGGMERGGSVGGGGEGEKRVGDLDTSVTHRTRTTADSDFQT